MIGEQSATSAVTQSANPSASSGGTHIASMLNQPFALKLDRQNYTLWKTMVFAIVRGHRLDGYVKEFKTWIVNDQLLLGWLYGSMIKTIATEVMGCDAASSLWQALETLFGAHSRVMMDEYRTKIQTTRKGSMSMADYLRQKRQWADVLALAGEPYLEKQLVSNILSSLDIEDLPIVLPVEAKVSTSWQELQDILLSFDNKLNRLTTLSGATKNLNLSSPSANVAATKPSGFPGNQKTNQVILA
uniref:Retrotransposon Copia-like N-terminal domain-containing protein n=1 Tax=Cannabis sativa TaxID=3483 RepID=A0A803P9R6_CANSA